LGGTIGATANWSSSLPMQLNGASFTFQSADASDTAHNILLNGALTGVGSLVKTGAGWLVLNATNTYSGATTVNAGSLGGSGVISGPVTINAGGALAPGNPLGTLTISNTVTLNTGSTAFMQVQHSPLTNTVLKVTGALTEGGTLNVTNSNATAFAAGDTFKLFSAGTYSGAFANVVLPQLSAGLGWNTSKLNVSGTISVFTSTPPVISSIKFAGTSLVISGTGGASNGVYYVEAATNLESPQWTTIFTNQFDANGNFAVTNLINAMSPEDYFRIEAP